MDNTIPEISEERLNAAISNLRNYLSEEDHSIDPKLMRMLASHYATLYKSASIIVTIEKELEYQKDGIKSSEGAIATLEYLLAEKILEKDPDIKAVALKMQAPVNGEDGNE